jgi:hypothetical protein
MVERNREGSNPHPHHTADETFSRHFQKTGLPRSGSRIQPRVKAIDPLTKHWSGLPLNRHELLPLDEAIETLPRFSLVAPESMGFQKTTHRNLIIVDPGSTAPDAPPILVAMVSPTYRLVQHSDVLKAAKAFLDDIDCETDGDILFSMTPNGERLHAIVNLGNRFERKPDGYPISLRLHFTNTTDGSGSMTAHLGWFRLVCSNGLTRLDRKIRSTMRHALTADPSRMFEPLIEQFKDHETQYAAYEAWSRTPVDLDSVRIWVDGPVTEAWGKLAAARIWNIATTGVDAIFAPPFTAQPASRRKIKPGFPVPGAPKQSRTLYDLAQAASWIASHRSDFEQGQAMQQQIELLIARLN